MSKSEASAGPRAQTLTREQVEPRQDGMASSHALHAGEQYQLWRSTVRNEFSNQRYDVHLHVGIHGPDQIQVDGVTDYISSHDIRFAVNEPLVMKLGTPVTLLVAVPREITAGNQVMIRAQGHVRRVESVSDSNGRRLTFTAAVKKFDFVRQGAPVNLLSYESHSVA